MDGKLWFCFNAQILSRFIEVRSSKAQDINHIVEVFWDILSYVDLQNEITLQGVGQ